eukprot:s583_g19.t1
MCRTMPGTCGARLLLEPWLLSCTATMTSPGRFFLMLPRLSKLFSHQFNLLPASLPAAQPLAPEVAPGAVACALRSFPPDAAPGPSGLRVQHFREACTTGSTEAVLQQLCGVFRLLAQGQACASVATRRWPGCPPKAAVRPIAVGEALRRLTAKRCGRTLSTTLLLCNSGSQLLEALKQPSTPVPRVLATTGGLEKCS